MERVTGPPLAEELLVERDIAVSEGIGLKREAGLEPVFERSKGDCQRRDVGVNFFGSI
jgi:hypothetical protein